MMMMMMMMMVMMITVIKRVIDCRSRTEAANRKHNGHGRPSLGFGFASIGRREPVESNRGDSIAKQTNKTKETRWFAFIPLKLWTLTRSFCQTEYCFELIEITSVKPSETG